MSKKKTSNLPYAHNLSSAIIKPEDIGKMKGDALRAMSEQVNIQMAQIYRQASALVEEANRLKERAEIGQMIYDADITLTPRSGNIYYFYERKEDGSNFLSLVAPEEWGSEKEKEFKLIHRVKMLADHTWEIL